MYLKTVSWNTYVLSKGTNALQHKAITSVNKNSKYLSNLILLLFGFNFYLNGNFF